MRLSLLLTARVVPAISLISPLDRSRIYPALGGDRSGPGACGDGVDSGWYPYDDMPSRVYSPMMTNLTLYKARIPHASRQENDLIRVSFSGGIRGIYRLDYWINTMEVDGQIDSQRVLTEEDFLPAIRVLNPNIAASDQLPIDPLYTSIGFFTADSCQMSTTGTLDSYWQIPLLPTDDPRHVIFRWQVLVGVSCCTHPSICGSTVSPIVKNWVSSNNRCKVALDTSGGDTCNLALSQDDSPGTFTTTRYCFDSWLSYDADESDGTLMRSDFYALVLRSQMSSECQAQEHEWMQQYCSSLLDEDNGKSFDAFARFCAESGSPNFNDCFGAYLAAA